MPPRIQLADPLLTVPTIAAMLGVNQATVYEWIARGDLPRVKLGRRIVRVRAQALDEFLRARTGRRSGVKAAR